MTVLYANIPNELKEKPQWLCWKYIPVPGKKPRKMPISPVTGGAGSSSDPETWSDFSTALSYFQKNKMAGVGYAFKGDYVGIDLDNCFNSGKITERALDVVNHCASYTERSPSMNGLHILVKGDLKAAHKTDWIEVYNRGRFFTFTGKIYNGMRHIKTADITRFLPSRDGVEPITDRIKNMKPGNVDNTLSSLAGTLFKKRFTEDEVFHLLKEKANQAGHDDSALSRVVNSISRYHKPEETNEQESESIPVYSAATHGREFLRSFDSGGSQEVELASGFPTIDKCTGGIKRGGVWVVGARTTVGKTSFCTSVAHNLLRMGKKVLMFSTEMDWVETMGRFASIEKGVSLHSITNAKHELTTQDKRELEKFSTEFESKPFFIIEESEPSLRVVSEKVSSIRPDVFIFDYIQHVAEGSDARHREISKFVIGIENIAKEFKCGAIVASQLNRGADLEKPRLRHLSESSSIENTARTVILLSKVVEGEATNIVCADLAKNRGPKKEVDLRLDNKTAFFTEVG